MLSRDGGYWLAYYGLGKAELNAGNYEKAMDYFEYAEANGSYDKAYQYYREQVLSDNFTLIIVVLLVIVVALVAWRIISKKRISGKKKAKKGGK